MSRGIGEFDPIQEVIPEWAAVFIALITQLGDTWFLAILVGVVYWFGTEKREDAVVIVGFTVAGLGLISGLKHVFRLPRPDEPLVQLESLPWIVQPLYDVTAAAGGYGFPSGHALMTTIVYFSLAHRLSISTRHRRLLGAAILVGAVCFSRVALGVHYLVDVVAGVGIGIAFLIGGEILLARIPTDHGTVALALAIGIGLFDLIVGDITAGDVILLGTALGSFGSWQLVLLSQRLLELDRPSQIDRPLIGRGLLAVGTLTPVLIAVEEYSLFSALGRGGAIGLTLAVFIAIPIARHSERARRFWVALVFWTNMAGLGVRFLLAPTTWQRAFSQAREYGSRLYR
ncbi:phosphatase PAP2 family protein [Halopiger djelfimassiliensis]|uniref:phosphatase PAP2 family protein n=1 Tax=Halopiger djelfimassiliensis TaxID=1293047 RepID=UPI000677CB51|nr:phosphatase PAP2 family protein [Halopiger djelfimassiliensis]